MLTLTKGGKLDLSKGNAAGISVFRIGLGWDLVPGKKFDLDVSAIVLKEDGKAYAPDSICFYNQLNWGNGAIKHSGDNRDGAGEGDDETITIDTAKLPEGVSRVKILISIFEAKKIQANFGMVKSASVRLYKGESGTAEADILAKYDLEEDSSMSCSTVVCELYKKDGVWKFQALAEDKGSYTETSYNKVLQSFGIDAPDEPEV